MVDFFDYSINPLRRISAEDKLVADGILCTSQTFMSAAISGSWGCFARGSRL